MFATTAPSGTAAKAKSVEEYRCYPQPELLELRLRRRRRKLTSPPPFSTSTTPDELFAPRNRSPVASSSSTEALADAHEGDVAGTDSTRPCSGAEEMEEREARDMGVEAEDNENKTGNYKTAPAFAAAPQTSAQQQQQQQLVAAAASAEVPAVAAAGDDDDDDDAVPRITVRLRWGFETADLRRVYEMHEDAFPLSYNPSFYEWLLDHDACMALVATVTADAYTHWTNTTAMEEEEQAMSAGAEAVAADAPLAWFPGYTPSPAEAAAGPRSVPPSASQRPPTVEVILERARIDSTLTELEYIAQRNRDKEAKTAEHTNSEKARNTEDSGAAAYTQVIGFILGQCAYARHDAGHLFTNPTAYIGSFVVDPRFQRCGLGSALLERFLTYVTKQRPLYAQDYLHYDERKLIAMLVKAQVQRRRAPIEAAMAGEAINNSSSSNYNNNTSTETKKEQREEEKEEDGARYTKKNNNNGGGSGAKSQGGKPSKASRAQNLPSFIEQIIAVLFPEVLAWWEDKRARQRLRARGMTDDEVDAQRFRDCLASDTLSDEEVDEVRRNAQHFLVQTGMREVWLHCLPGNMKATQLYARRGFRLHRLLKDYYDISGERYDANLLLYSCPVVGGAAAAGEGRDGRRDVAADTTALFPTVDTGMDAVVKQYDSRALAPHGGSSVAMANSTTEGLRRRHVGHPAGEAATESAHVNTPLPSTEATAGIPLDAADSNSGRVESDTASLPSPGDEAEATRLIAAPAARPSDARHALFTASWLSPCTYAVVADVILCSATEGREEWQRRISGSGDVTGQRSWWETAREVGLLINALGLLCAVAWVAYNACLTGRVE